jgi:hypothetical protein
MTVRVWKQRNDEQLERLLRANRPQPREEFVTTMLQRLDSTRRRLRRPPQRLTARIVAAGALTALVLAAAAAAGGAHTVATSVSGLVNVAQQGLNSSNQPISTVASSNSSHQDKNDSNGKDDNGNGDDQGSAGDQQYAVTICHHTGSATNPWVELTLSPQGAANHLAHHPDDFIVTSTTPCPPPTLTNAPKTTTIPFTAATQTATTPAKTTTTASQITAAPKTTTIAPTTTAAAPTTAKTETAGKATTTVPSATRWWAASSPFNTPAPANASLDPNSATWVSMLNNSSQVNSIVVNSTSWTTTLYHANANTPHVVVSVANTGKHISIPYQAGWATSPDADAHIAIIDDSTGCEYEFEMFSPSNLSSHAVAVFHLYSGSGAHVADAGETGGDMSVLGGLITPQDVASGSINHAMRMATPVNGPSYRLPATRSDGSHTGGIPMGALIRLDPSLDLSQYNLTPFQAMLAKALQIYGAYNDDSGGALAVFAESTSDGSHYSQPISGLPKSLVSHLQVVAPLYSSLPLDSNAMSGCNAPY